MDLGDTPLVGSSGFLHQAVDILLAALLQMYRAVAGSDICVSDVQALFRKVAGALPGMESGSNSQAETMVSVDLTSQKPETDASTCNC